MSYDLMIRADREYSKFVPFEPVARFVGQLSHVRPNGTSRFILDDPPQRWMNIDLAVAGEYDDSTAASDTGATQINCIQLCIPYAFLGDAPERDYFPIALEIAGLLGWKLYDNQTGKNMSASPKPDPERGAFYREVMAALGLSEAPAKTPRPKKTTAKGKTTPAKGKTTSAERKKTTSAKGKKAAPE
jgi:hypothetical protein